LRLASSDATVVLGCAGLSVLRRSVVLAPWSAIASVATYSPGAGRAIWRHVIAGRGPAELQHKLIDADHSIVHDSYDADAGGGRLWRHGRFAEILPRRGHYVIGVDSSPDMLAHARPAAAMD
jgi:SAM-dependent methyltransferase